MTVLFVLTYASETWTLRKKDERSLSTIQRSIERVEEVLYDQRRSAFLPDNVISLILQQLDVQISYEPLKSIIDNTLTGKMDIQTMVNCVVIDDTVTNICMGMQQDSCHMKAMVEMNLKAVNLKHFTISGRIKTSNAIMANWSSQMWQSVLNRVLRRITSGE